ncbi:PaaI family thioesterase [Alloalcanivorax mobilis]|uniref:PaaI family thioesterase n=1 Tax=Alloalcanivorax mobilis TaxID=2019569 RepID=UPI001E613A42|nr:PaaI family thioesterase [Alloalcanivorax mobilis]
MDRSEPLAWVMQAPFLELLGVEAVAVSPGEVTSRLALRRQLQQQNGYVHAGVVGTIADHTAGAAAATMMADGMMPLTVEFKVNLLRPALGAALVCVARVLKAGRAITVAESEVFAEDAAGERKLVAKATVTLALVARR